MHPIKAQLHTLNIELHNNLRVSLFGFHLPYLPDFLLDHTLLGHTHPEKINEVLSRFSRFVTGFRKYHNAAYSLRYITDPTSGSINVYLLGRILDKPGKVEHLAWLAVNDARQHLLSFGFMPRPLATSELSTVCKPFGNNSQVAIVEIRQQEEVIKINPRGDQLSNTTAYLVHPYFEAQGALLEPFENLVRQTVPVVLSVFIQPTEVSSQELEDIDAAAQKAQTLADLSITPQSQVGIQRWRDPAADMIGRKYAAYRKSLNESFLGVVQVASLDPSIAWNIARSFASSISHTSQTAEGELTVQPAIILPKTASDNENATKTLEALTLHPWGEIKATSGKERFPYLMGAKAASAIFRFPISVRGGVPGIIVRQTAPDFEPGPRPEHPPIGEIQIGQLHRGGLITARVNDFTRHTLVTGFTGSGKTNTVLFLLNQLWKQQKIPFLVIEAAKKEYRALSNANGFEKLLVFTLGDETVSPFRFNPFELLLGVRVEAHIGRLQACFDAALPQFGILPSLIAETLEEIYKEKNWKLTDRHDQPDESRTFPTMRDMLRVVIRTVEGRGYNGEMRDNIRAASAGRISSLLRGSRGRMFGCQRSFPADKIFNSSVVLELNDLNEDDKALTMMFLLMWLREYRELHPSPRLQHLTVIEEAHNVVGNVVPVGNTEISADTKAKAVSSFSNMLAEVRSYGEGILISDQSPEKLAPDALRNTNLQISHQLRDRHDREAIARAMIMDDEQQNYLGKLRLGEAAIFKAEMEKATFIHIPEFIDSAGLGNPPNDNDIKKQMQPFQDQHKTSSLPFDGCRFCGSPCKYREAVEPFTLDREKAELLKIAMKHFDEKPQPEHWPGHWMEIVKVCLHVSEKAINGRELDAAYCYLAHEVDFPFTEHMRKQFHVAFEKLDNG